MTIGHFLDSRTGYRMLISRGTALNFPGIPCEELTAVVHVEKPVRSYLEEVLTKGVAHHVVLTHGDVTRELEQICDLLNIKKFVV